MSEKPPLPPRFGDPRKQDEKKQHEDKRNICRQFLWGKCTKFEACRYRHVLDIPEMQKTVKFCRDYQNRVGCNGENCTYLHTTKEEQKLFHESGVLPKVLKDRHAALVALATNSNNNVAIFNNSTPAQPQNTAYQRPPIELSPDSIAMPPPPPPPPLPPAPLPVPVQPAPRFAAPLIAQPPPPPPPVTTQFPITASTSGQSSQPMVNGNSSPGLHSFTPQQQPATKPPVPPFDASRPPPPVAKQDTPSTGAKRKLPDVQIDAVTGKTAKPDDQEFCPSCRELDKRTNELKVEVDKLIDKEAKCNFELKKKTEEYEAKRRHLFSLIAPEYQKPVSALIDASGSGTVPTQAWLQLMECVLNKNALRSPVNPVSAEDTLITNLTRRVTSNAVPGPADSNDVSSISNAIRSACMMNSTSSEEIEQELQEIVRNLNTTRATQPPRPNAQALPNDISTISRSVNFVSLESVAGPSREAPVGFERNAAVAPIRPPVTTVRFPYQPTVAAPTPATYAPVTYAQTSNATMPHPAIAAPSPQIPSTSEASSVAGCQSNFNQRVNGRYNNNVGNFPMKPFP